MKKLFLFLSPLSFFLFTPLILELEGPLWKKSWFLSLTRNSSLSGRVGRPSQNRKSGPLKKASRQMHTGYYDAEKTPKLFHTLPPYISKYGF